MGYTKFLGVAALAAVGLAIDIPAVPTWPSGQCTDKSLTIPSWIISNYRVVGGTTTFNVQNRANTGGSVYDIKCTAAGKCQGNAASSQMRESISLGPDGNPVVNLTETWVCSDEGDK